MISQVLKDKVNKGNTYKTLVHFGKLEGILLNLFDPQST